jgi:hypothetical protein
LLCWLAFPFPYCLFPDNIRLVGPRPPLCFPPLLDGDEVP